MSEAQHALTPWKVGYEDNYHSAGSPNCKDTCGKGESPIRVEGSMHYMPTDLVGDIISADGDHVVCLGHDYDDYGSVNQADAEFICRAVNSYDALLAACRFGLKRCEDNGFPNGDLAIVLREAIQKDEETR